MDRDRFNALLADIDQITDEDIKSLNQLRKQYPYFQNQYVMIARALKKRDHPKTDAFIKKAAIYSADRGVLKGIITDDDYFAQAPAQPEPVKETAVKKPEPIQEKAVTPEPPVTKAVEVEKAKVVKKEKAPPPASKQAPPKPAPKAEPTATSEKSPEPTDSTTDTQMISDLEKDLAEIREKKRLIAKMLEQSDARSASDKAASSAKKPAKPKKKSQSELIEKFIQNEPQMEKQKLIKGEADNEQEDLAAKNIRESDDFHTETLAKLMIKQKKYKKAIEIYEKLGLKFPEKRAYFASQIEKVNNRSNV